ncbi:MAG: Holliday junction branch migration protein RuvA [Candidatus Cloacimonetes bacterium HGW-Cloacimonetes-1]|jgi:Holliday junction DNA helicase RuvA|nr:MAG: Holliday junction branch migration protein RuvA [Candidatus Cloacimonetes bacterium HGW-Cloacimonetes-1]
MIHHISGRVFEKNPVYVVLETSGIGFDIKIPLSTYEVVPKVGDSCSLYTYLHSTQDDTKLFGFSTKAEKELFLMLIGVSGVGPKIALSILSTLTISTFAKAIQRSDEITIAKVPGLGKKSAQRLIVELKDSVLKLTDHIDSATDTLSDQRLVEAESALQSLGFNIKDIRRELNLLPEDILSLPTERIIKESIKRIYQKSK